MDTFTWPLARLIVFLDIVDELLLVERRDSRERLDIAMPLGSLNDEGGSKVAQATAIIITIERNLTGAVMGACPREWARRNSRPPGLPTVVPPRSCYLAGSRGSR